MHAHFNFKQLPVFSNQKTCSVLMLTLYVQHVCLVKEKRKEKENVRFHNNYLQIKLSNNNVYFQHIIF